MPKLEQGARRRGLALQQLVRRVPVTDHVAATPCPADAWRGEGAPTSCASGSWGAGPRASHLVLGAKTRVKVRPLRARHRGRRLSPRRCCGHRVVTNFTAEAEGVKPDRIIADPLKNVPTD